MADTPRNRSKCGAIHPASFCDRCPRGWSSRFYSISHRVDFNRSRPRLPIASRPLSALLMPKQASISNKLFTDGSQNSLPTLSHSISQAQLHSFQLISRSLPLWGITELDQLTPPIEFAERSCFDNSQPARHRSPVCSRRARR